MFYEKNKQGGLKMKKRIIVFMLLITVFTFYAYSKEIRLIEPSVPIVWKIGSTHLIEWSSVGIRGNIMISLFQNGTKMGDIYKGPNSGIYQWYIKNYTDGTPISEGVYILKVISRRFPAISAETKLILANNPTIYILKPSTEVNWNVGEKRWIEWVSGGITGPIKISLIKDGKSIGVIYKGPNTGSFHWEIEKKLNGKEIPTGPLSLKISSLTMPSIFSKKRIILSSKTKCHLRLIYPPTTQGRVFVKDKIIKVRWKSSECPENTIMVTVLLMKNGQCSEDRSNHQIVFSKLITDKGVFRWVLPDNLTPGVYRIELKKEKNKVYSGCFTVLFKRKSDIKGNKIIR